MNKILNSNINLRDIVNKNDPDKIRILVNKTGFFTPEEEDIAVELAEEFLSKGEKSGYNFIFAEINEEMVGYSCYGLIPCSKVSYDLYWIVVDKLFQGKGIGKIINIETEKRIKSLGGVQIFAETSSKKLYSPTREFYVSAGYTITADIDDFYDIGDGKTIFVKKL